MHRQIDSESTWECFNCTYTNSNLLHNCQMCQCVNPKSSSKKIKAEQGYTYVKKQPDVIKQNVCKYCTYENQKGCRICQSCSQSLFEEIIKCQYCSFQNSIELVNCLSCEKLLKQKQIIKIPQKKENVCPFCQCKIRENLYARHIQQCQKSQLLLKSFQPEFKEDNHLISCSYCDVKFQKKQLQAHMEICVQKFNFFGNQDTFSRLTPLQKQTIIFMHDHCAENHLQSRQPLLTRIKKLGFNTQDLEALHHYLQNYAPIIVHVHLFRYVQFFIKDTHYRNQFQTNTSSGSLSRQSRTSWEDRMFVKKYHYAKDFQRVKYGTVNFTNDPNGVGICRGYGSSYMLLKTHVRSRCTFTDMDSSAANSTIGTFKFSYQVINKFSDAQLQAALKAAKAMQVDSSIISTYKQIQIHGPIQFSKDIERVYINRSQFTNTKKLDQSIEFCKKHKIDYQIFGGQPPKLPPTLPVSAPGLFGGPGLFGARAIFPPPKFKPASLFEHPKLVTGLFSGYRQRQQWEQYPYDQGQFQDPDYYQE